MRVDSAITTFLTRGLGPLPRTVRGAARGLDRHVRAHPMTDLAIVTSASFAIGALLGTRLARYAVVSGLAFAAARALAPAPQPA
jgi:hypothetical protein